MGRIGYQKGRYYCSKCRRVYDEEEIARGRNNVPLCPVKHRSRQLRSQPKDLEYKDASYVEI